MEFHSDKVSHSWGQDGEKALLAAVIALLGGLSQMKRHCFKDTAHSDASLLSVAPRFFFFFGFFLTL